MAISGALSQHTQPVRTDEDKGNSGFVEGLLYLVLPLLACLDSLDVEEYVALSEVLDKCVVNGTNISPGVLAAIIDKNCHRIIPRIPGPDWFESLLPQWRVYFESNSTP